MVVILVFLAVAALLSLKTQPISQDPLAESAKTIEPIITHTSNVRVESSPTPLDESYPYPGVTESILPTSAHSITLTPVLPLPIIANYPEPGPFKQMKIFYYREERLNYFISDIDGKGEIEFINWWKSKIVDKVGPTNFKMAPDGSKFLFSFWNNMNLKEPTANSIWISDPDGSNPLLLVTGENGSYPEEPIWSPDSKKIAFRINRYRENTLDIEQVQIWTMNSDGSDQKMVKSYPSSLWNSFGGTAYYFKWLKNGYIYFLTRDHILSALNPNTGQTYNVLEQVTDEHSIGKSLSADGTQMLISPTITVGLIKISGVNQVPIEGDNAGWSDDGKYAVKKGSVFNDKPVGIWIVDALTRNGLLVTKDLSAVLYGISPDNRFFAYHTKAGIFIYDIGSGNSRLTIPSDTQFAKEWTSVHNLIWVPIK